MADDVEVPFNDNPSDQAVLLLAAAEELGHGPAVVKTGNGTFIVPQDVHDKAFGDDSSVTEEEPKPTKKAATKRTAAKKKG